MVACFANSNGRSFGGDSGWFVVTRLQLRSIFFQCGIKKKANKQTNMASHVNSSPPSIGWPARRINLTAALLLSVMHQFGIFLFFSTAVLSAAERGRRHRCKNNRVVCRAGCSSSPPATTQLSRTVWVFFFGGSVDTDFIPPPLSVVHTGWILVPPLLGQLGPLPPSFSRF